MKSSLGDFFFPSRASSGIFGQRLLLHDSPLCLGLQITEGKPVASFRGNKLWEHSPEQIKLEIRSILYLSSGDTAILMHALQPVYFYLLS